MDYADDRNVPTKVVRTQFERAAQDDVEKIYSGKHIVISAITPLTQKEQIEPYRKSGFHIEDSWVIERAHVYMAFLSPRTNEIEVTTSYNSPTNPPYLIHRGKVDPIGLEDKGETLYEKYHNPVHLRDIEAIIDSKKRELHKTSTISIPCSLDDRNKLEEALLSARKTTELPLYYAPTIPSGHKDCQTATISIFMSVFSSLKMPVPQGSSITSINCELMEESPILIDYE